MEKVVPGKVVICWIVGPKSIFPYLLQTLFFLKNCYYDFTKFSKDFYDLTVSCGVKYAVLYVCLCKVNLKVLCFPTLYPHLLFFFGFKNSFSIVHLSCKQLNIAKFYVCYVHYHKHLP
jgi:hypothetical protein